MGVLNQPKIDLTGRQINYYKVIGWMFNEKRNCNQWLCKCICGEERFNSSYELTSGKHKSCGCMTSKIKSDNKTISLVGQRFERLLVLERIDGEFRTPKGVPQIKYRCLCDCGNIIEVYAGNLKKGNTKSCGCLNKELISQRRLINLIGQTFYKLTVIKRAEDYISPSGNKSSQWLCKCECGNYVVVNGNSLRRGLTKSCGCIKDSYGEAAIAQYLKEKNINFEREYKFDDLLTENGYNMRFDFAIFNSEDELICLIEYQGPQHYKDYFYNDKTFGEYQRKVSDPAKKKYCKNNNITLYEIKYDEDITLKLNEIFNVVKVNMSTPCQASE